MNIEKLLSMIRQEIKDERFEGLIHGTRNAAAVGGCHGPMCRKFHRDKVRHSRARRDNRIPPPSRTPEIDKIIDLAIASHAEDIMRSRTEQMIKRIV